MYTYETCLFCNWVGVIWINDTGPMSDLLMIMHTKCTICHYVLCIHLCIQISGQSYNFFYNRCTICEKLFNF